MVIMLLINPSIDTSVSMMSTANGYDVARWLADCCFSSYGIKYRCGDFRSFVSHDSSQSILLPRSIAAALTVVYYSGAGLVTKGDLRQRKAS